MSPYSKTFEALQPEHDPRHIEAFVRLEHSTLDHLPIDELAFEASLAARCVEEGGVEAAERIALSFGL